MKTDKTTAKYREAGSRTKKLIISGVILLACLWLGIGGVLLYRQINDSGDSGSSTGSVALRLPPSQDGNNNETPVEASISAAIEKASPSVVSVVTEAYSDSSLYGGAIANGAATGVIVSSDGYVLTNKHVVEGAQNLSVALADGTIYDKVAVVATDPLNDLAFLKIPNVNNLQQAQLGDSTTIRVGQQVIAIGNSLGQYQNTVTSGIISGTGRPVAAQNGNSYESLVDLLQTDAAINPGNSGGPLLNTSGQVIGINTAIAQDAEGIGFAIPINAAKGILKQVLAGKPAERAYLGVRYVPVNAALATRFDLAIKRGAYVYASDGQTAVVAGSPADKAGIKLGDVITKVGDVEVGSSGGVSSLIAEYAPGDMVQITINSAGKTRVVDVRLTAYQN